MSSTPEPQDSELKPKLDTLLNELQALRNSFVCLSLTLDDLKFEVDTDSREKANSTVKEALRSAAHK